MPLGTELVLPLEPVWEARLRDIARARRWPVIGESALVDAVVATSAAYNALTPKDNASRDGHAARLGFFFARDVPKASGAIRELLRTHPYPSDRPLRLLDIGAGMGATTLGVVRALRANGHAGPIESTLVDVDARALEVANEVLATERVTVRIRDVVPPNTPAASPYDLILMGQVLNELDPNAPDRVAKHADLLHRYTKRLNPDGALVVIEPALRVHSRHLAQVRGALIAAGSRPFAPCLHARGCPLLQREADWCHEELDVELPEWLVDVASDAGLRDDRLTFSYLVIRRDGASLRSALPSGCAVRAVSRMQVSKGKQELHVCGDRDGRLMRLDRHASPANEPWERIARGDLVQIPAEGARVGPDDAVREVP